MNREIVALASLVATALVLIACAAPVAHRVALIGSDTRTLDVGDSLQLSVVVTGTSSAVVWGTSDDSVATVTSTGYVTAHSVGTVVITATSGIDPDAWDAVTIQVATAPAVHGVTIEPTGQLGLLIGEATTLVATVDAVGGADTGVTWHSTDEAVATVEHGVVVGVGAGTTEIVAASVVDPNQTATITITVSEHPSIVSVTIAPGSEQSLVVGESRTFVAHVVASGDIDTTVAWTSSDPAVASVDEGVVEAAAVGVSLITATSVADPTRFASVAVAVNEAPAIASVTILGPNTREVEAGGSLLFTAQVATEGEIDGSVAWTATCGGIQGSGMTVTYLAPDAAMQCTVRATSVADPAFHASVLVTVTAPLSGELVWLREFGSPDSDERGLHVDLGPGGEVLFGGTTDGAPWAYSTGGLAAVAGELDASGATSWIHQFGGESTYLPLAVRITADGTRVTAGTTPEGLFMRTVDHLGASLTFESFGNEALGESVSAMSVARDRSIVVAGQTETGLGDLDPGPGPSGWRNPYVIRFTQLGDLDWVARLIADSEMLDSAESVEVDGSGRIHLIGSRYRGQTYVAQLQGNGAQAWLDPLYFEFESWYRFGFDVAASSAGRTLAVGRWEPPNPYSPPRGFLAAYPASGAPATVTIVGPAEFTTATAVAAAPDDFTVVAGVTHGLFGEVLGSATQAAAFLAKYAPDGTLVWVRSVAPGRDTEISDVAVGHDGSTTLVGTVDGQVLVARYGP